MTNVPFAAHNTASDPTSLNNNHRLKLYRKFMGKDWFGASMAIDIGPRNHIANELSIPFHTVGDLNYSFHYEVVHPGEAEYITCFEVIQHVMNPLSLIEKCFQRLKTGGFMYIATPKQWLIPWYHGRENFTEYKPENLEQMFRYVGFEIVRRETHNPWPLRFMFYGVRPFFRVLFNRFVIWELRKP